MIAFFVQAKNVHHLEWNLCIMSIVEIIPDEIQHSRSNTVLLKTAKTENAVFHGESFPPTPEAVRDQKRPISAKIQNLTPDLLLRRSILKEGGCNSPKAFAVLGEPYAPHLSFLESHKKQS